MNRPIASMPTWMIPIILGGLVVISSAIVIVGWTLTQPDEMRAACPDCCSALRGRKGEGEKGSDSSLRVSASPLLPFSPSPPSPGGRLALPEADQPKAEPLPQKPERPNIDDPVVDTVVLKRQLASADIIVHVPSATGKEPPLKSPLRWTLEKPSGGIGLIMPIEVAKIDDGQIQYTVRRLQFPDSKPEKLKLAVTPFMHDDLGSVLTKMGAGYAFTQLRKADVFSFDTLKKYDVVFLTCADLYAQDFQAAHPLRKFVAGGGTLYASDLRGDLLLAAFPEFRAKTPLLPGVPQKVDASVTDDGLRAYLGRKTIPLSFEAPDWRPASFDPAKVTVCLKSEYRDNQGRTVPGPLLVKFRHLNGTVVFTSFHHTKNDSQIVRKLLDYLVFATVNARSEARLRDLMHRYQFSLHEMRPAALNPDAKFEGTYQHQGGGLQIALGFENQGAKLKLTLRSPSGKTIEHVDQGLYLIEVPKAEPGVWRYEVTPIALPHRNFPILIAVSGLRS